MLQKKESQTWSKGLSSLEPIFESRTAEDFQYVEQFAIWNLPDDNFENNIVEGHEKQLLIS